MLDARELNGSVSMWIYGLIDTMTLSPLISGVENSGISGRSGSTGELSPQLNRRILLHNKQMKIKDLVFIMIVFKRLVNQIKKARTITIFTLSEVSPNTVQS